MTSVQASYSQSATNKLYTNLVGCQSSIFTSSGTTVVAWVNSVGALSTAGNAVFRDLGKTLYLPSPTAVPVGAVPGISTVLRKVQLIPFGPNGTYGTGGPASGIETDYYTGYIQLSGLQQGGGGNGAPVKFVRLN
jgi:hypothetical protein